MMGHHPEHAAPAPRILIVDAEPAQVRALCDTLTAQGYDAVGFSSAAPALAALGESRFDLLLSDLTMPQTNGIALLQQALTVDPDLVGIVTTDDGSVSTAVDALQDGAFDYILKPIEVSVVLPVLSRALTMRRLRMENVDLAGQLQARTSELDFATKELEAFSYSVSHDLRAPLRAVLGFSRILAEKHAGQMPSEANSILDTIIEGATRMGQLIDDLLRFSHLARQPLSKEHIDLNALVREIVNELTREQEGRSVDVQIGDLPATIGDPALMKQVLLNLLGNAFKFTRGREHAEIAIGCQQAESEQVYFVRDNGDGFDMRYATNLFGVFQRMHREDEFEGTGVGLSIAQRVILRHGGRIWAAAEKDKGATFFFTLPGQPPRT